MKWVKLDFGAERMNLESYAPIIKEYYEVTCPFCGHRNIIYLWSFYGGGKRCMNTQCRAFLAIPEAVRDMVPATLHKETKNNG